MDSQYIEDIFTYHAPTTAKVKQHESVRDLLKKVAHSFREDLPDSPEKTLAIRRLQEAMMYANAAIAIHS